MRRIRIPTLGGARAFILHRPHPTVQALSRQLTAIGLEVTEAWPEASADVLGADYVFFDADMGHDGMFPWAPGQSPMPMIALIGSEADRVVAAGGGPCATVETGGRQRGLFGAVDRTGRL